jgi:hypothetical protein
LKISKFESGVAKPWCRPHPRIRHDERWIGELRDLIFTFDERSMGGKYMTRIRIHMEIPYDAHLKISL